MPKVKLPLLSAEARGQFAKLMIFVRGGVVRNYFKPRNPKSAAQEAHRADFKEKFMTYLTKLAADLLYAALGHLHDDRYSDLGHLHDDRYSGMGHTHDLLYSLLSHLHDDRYSDLGHLHDSRYAQISHTHSGAMAAVGVAPNFVDGAALLYFLDAGNLMVRMKLGVSEKEILLATMQTQIEISMSADAYCDSANPTTNFDAATNIAVGKHNAAASIRRSWIKPDFSSVPAGRTFVSAVLKLTPITDLSSNTRTMRAHRCLQIVVSGQMTQGVYSTGNNWGAGGASDSSVDYDGAVEMGNMVVDAAAPLNTALSMTLDAAELQKLYDGTHPNNGIILFVDTQVSDLFNYASKEHATAAYRPVIVLTYV